MIPTMDEILEQLSKGKMDLDTAKLFIQQHMQNLVDIAAQRQYFAAEAMNGILASDGLMRSCDDTAARAVAYADAIIARMKA